MDGSSCKLEVKVLKKYFADLCIALPIDDLLPRLVSENIITIVLKKAIIAKGTQSARTEHFLEESIIRSLEVGCADSFYKLLKMMKDSSVSGSSCGQLADRIICDLPADIAKEICSSASDRKDEASTGKWCTGAGCIISNVKVMEQVTHAKLIATGHIVCVFVAFGLYGILVIVPFGSVIST